MRENGFEKLSLYSSPKPPLVETTRKRTKDTSGIDASHTSQARPLAKRFTIRVQVKRLSFPAYENLSWTAIIVHTDHP